MTSNLGAGEMSSLMSPGLGFSGPRPAANDPRNEKMTNSISNAGIAAARRKFTPEFMNRLDKIVVFKPLGDEQLRRILDLELARVHERVFHGTPFLFQLSASAKDHLLEKGTDARYGARHLKRAIERSLVHPMANLIATEQIRTGDLIEVDLDAGRSEMTFERVSENLPVHAMARAAGIELPESMEATAALPPLEFPATTEAQGISRK